MSGPLFESHPLVGQWLALFLSVTPETPFEDLRRVSEELWRIYQRAEREVPGAIMAALDRLTPRGTSSRARRGSRSARKPGEGGNGQAGPGRSPHSPPGAPQRGPASSAESRRER